jgi:hypothetical protein
MKPETEAPVVDDDLDQIPQSTEVVHQTAADLAKRQLFERAVRAAEFLGSVVDDGEAKISERIQAAKVILHYTLATKKAEEDNMSNFLRSNAPGAKSE